MATTFVEEAYSALMESHEWTYDEISDLMELLDNKLIDLSEEESMWPQEVYFDDWDYGIIEKENWEALIP